MVMRTVYAGVCVMYVYMYMYMYVCMYVCVCLCVDVDWALGLARHLNGMPQPLVGFWSSNHLASGRVVFLACLVCVCVGGMGGGYGWGV